MILILKYYINVAVLSFEIITVFSNISAFVDFFKCLERDFNFLPKMAIWDR